MVNGILIVDKPQGFTSHDVVAKLRGMLRQKKIGHAGTLDPMATGVLVVLLGNATRASDHASGQSKEYVARLRLGQVTDTQDVTGTVLEEHPVTVGEEELRQILPAFTGDIQQLPPMYSAISVNGKRLYDLARKGVEVERQSRDIVIEELELLEKQADMGDHDYDLRARCSKGTYVRTICHDIGAKLGCGGCMSALRRVSAGGFSVAQAHKLSEVQRFADEGRVEELLIPVDELFSDYEKCVASSAAEKRIRCGNEYKTNVPDGEYRVYSEAGEFLMLGKAESGVMKTIKSFFEVS